MTIPLTQERLRELVDYDPDTGRFTRLGPPAGNAKARQECGSVASNGYRVIMVAGHRYQAHRLVWLYVHGRFPTHEIDHINGNRDDNRLCNLREATRFQNQQNRKRSKNNSTGFAGVICKSGRFYAQIRHGGVTHRLGYYGTVEEAGAAYLGAKRVLHTFQPVPRDTSPRFFITDAGRAHLEGK